jgi:hypothetical protein
MRVNKNIDKEYAQYQSANVLGLSAGKLKLNTKREKGCKIVTFRPLFFRLLNVFFLTTELLRAIIGRNLCGLYV